MIFAFDMETTGLDVEKDEPVEVGFALLDDGPEYYISSFMVNTAVPINEKAQAVHGFSAESVKRGLPVQTMVALIEGIFKQNQIDAILGYNAFKFDIPMLNATLRRNGSTLDLTQYKAIDPAMWYLCDKIYNQARPADNAGLKVVAEIYVPKGTRYNLETVCGLYEVPLVNAHQASGDLCATIELWKKMR